MSSSGVYGRSFKAPQENCEAIFGDEAGKSRASRAVADGLDALQQLQLWPGKSDRIAPLAAAALPSCALYRKPGISLTLGGQDQRPIVHPPAVN
jgi:hypothetical protein